MNYDRWIITYESWPMDYDLWIMTYQLWPMDYDWWIVIYRLWLMNHDLWIMTYNLRFLWTQMLIYSQMKYVNFSFVLQRPSLEKGSIVSRSLLENFMKDYLGIRIIIWSFNYTSKSYISVSHPGFDLLCRALCITRTKLLRLIDRCQRSYRKRTPSWCLVRDACSAKEMLWQSTDYTNAQKINIF